MLSPLVFSPRCTDWEQHGVRYSKKISYGFRFSFHRDVACMPCLLVMLLVDLLLSGRSYTSALCAPEEITPSIHVHGWISGVEIWHMLCALHLRWTELSLCSRRLFES